jgi:hypothetical protein
MGDTSIRIDQETKTELLKIIGYLQAKTGKTITADDALKELLENYKKKTRN